MKNKLVSNKEAYEIAPLIAFSNHFTTENGISAKSWYPKDEQNIETSQWVENDINIVFYSTGLCKLSFSLNEESSNYSWGVRFLDQTKNEMKTIRFAPLYIDANSKRKSRQIKLERRIEEINESFIKEANYIQLVNLQ